MPLIEPAELCPPAQLGGVHFIAIGGSGMSGVAALYAQLGLPVSGSDRDGSPVLDELRALGVRAHVGHDAAQLGDADTVVVSTAIRPDNPELAAARDRGLRVWHRSAALGALMLGHTGVAVCGTHGKTTTSAMVAWLLAACGADPGYVVGSPLADTGVSYHLGAGDVFVVEADESDGSMRQYPAEIVVVTNVEADHLDNWITEENYAHGMLEFATGPSVRVAVVCGDDSGARALIEPIRAAGVRVVVVGACADADVRLADGRLTADGDAGELRLALHGPHNLLNAAAAYAVGRELGLPGSDLRAAAATFHGTSRRFQTVAEVDGVWIVDDYAHHPTELVATLTTARTLAGGRLIACFQPHLYSRTVELADGFGEVLALADEAVVLDVYPAREDPIPGVTGELVARAAEAAMPGRVRYVPVFDDAPAVLADLVRPGDLVLTIGAGDVTGIGPRLAALLEQR